MLSEPLAGWRHIEITNRRTKKDYAQILKYLVDERYPHAQVITVVQDNLNTHVKNAVYEAFPPQEAKRLLDKLEFHYTPKHGSWLNIAEIELSVLSGQCLAQRIPDPESLKPVLAAWETERNAKGAKLTGVLLLKMLGLSSSVFIHLFLLKINGSGFLFNC